MRCRVFALFATNRLVSGMHRFCTCVKTGPTVRPGAICQRVKESSGDLQHGSFLDPGRFLLQHDAAKQLPKHRVAAFLLRGQMIVRFKTRATSLNGCRLEELPFDVPAACSFCCWCVVPSPPALRVPAPWQNIRADSSIH